MISGRIPRIHETVLANNFNNPKGLLKNQKKIVIPIDSIKTGMNLFKFKRSTDIEPYQQCQVTNRDKMLEEWIKNIIDVPANFSIIGSSFNDG